MNTGGSVVPEHDAFFLFLKKTREISGETLFSFNFFEESWWLFYFNEEIAK